LRVAIVDASALFASLDADEDYHAACVRAMAQPDLRLVIPTLVITEVCQLIEGRRLDPRYETQFLASLSANDIQPPVPGDWLRIAELVEKYADFPLGAVDASVIALAERLETDLVITLDRRHFSAVQPNHCGHLQLLP